MILSRKHVAWSAPTLFRRPFILATDASGIAISAILSQKYEIEHPICYASRSLKDAETRYSTIEREALAIVWAVKYFRCYLTGARFTIITDHRPLKYLLTIKEPSSRLAKWAMSLTEFDFEVQYRPGKQHHVDAFTRLEHPQEEMSIQAIQQDCTPIIYNLEEIKKAQSEDKDIQSLLPQEGYYQSPNGLCYRERLDGERHDKLLVPKTMQRRILQLYHDSPFMAHGGRTKTTELLKREFYWKVIQPIADHPWLINLTIATQEPHPLPGSWDVTWRETESKRWGIVVTQDFPIPLAFKCGTEYEIQAVRRSPQSFTTDYTQTILYNQPCPKVPDTSFSNFLKYPVHTVPWILPVLLTFTALVFLLWLLLLGHIIKSSRQGKTHNVQNQNQGPTYHRCSSIAPDPEDPPNETTPTRVDVPYDVPHSPPRAVFTLLPHFTPEKAIEAIDILAKLQPPPKHPHHRCRCVKKLPKIVEEVHYANIGECKEVSVCKSDRARGFFLLDLRDKIVDLLLGNHNVTPHFRSGCSKIALSGTLLLGVAVRVVVRKKGRHPGVDPTPSSHLVGIKMNFEDVTTKMVDAMTQTTGITIGEERSFADFTELAEREWTEVHYVKVKMTAISPLDMSEEVSPAIIISRDKNDERGLLRSFLLRFNPVLREVMCESENPLKFEVVSIKQRVTLTEPNESPQPPKDTYMFVIVGDELEVANGSLEKTYHSLVELKNRVKLLPVKQIAVACDLRHRPEYHRKMLEYIFRERKEDCKMDTVMISGRAPMITYDSTLREVREHLKDTCSITSVTWINSGKFLFQVEKGLGRIVKEILLSKMGQYWIAWKGPNTQFRRPEKKQDVFCYKCWELGHLGTECKGVDRRHLCQWCGEEGHTRKECTNHYFCPVCNQNKHRARTPRCGNTQKKAQKAAECTENTKTIQTEERSFLEFRKLVRSEWSDTVEYEKVKTLAVSPFDMPADVATAIIISRLQKEEGALLRSLYERYPELRVEMRECGKVMEYGVKYLRQSKVCVPHEDSYVFVVVANALKGAVGKLQRTVNALLDLNEEVRRAGIAKIAVACDQMFKLDYHRKMLEYIFRDEEVEVTFCTPLSGEEVDISLPKKDKPSHDTIFITGHGRNVTYRSLLLEVREHLKDFESVITEIKKVHRRKLLMQIEKGQGSYISEILRSKMSQHVIYLRAVEQPPYDGFCSKCWEYGHTRKTCQGLNRFYNCRRTGLVWIFKLQDTLRLLPLNLIFEAFFVLYVVPYQEHGILSVLLLSILQIDCLQIIARSSRYTSHRYLNQGAQNLFIKIKDRCTNSNHQNGACHANFSGNCLVRNLGATFK
ncbi:hypothetical protein TcasGA2_TC031231 [Tribolium castaneum]|uniref:RNA-directed DNA polymerase n=1 Tax=Tribolium castaneum TaxID=7070 RepID=A0A139WCF3_TRICA|nr:hypothetical protein TcasGA2_TC031231 [Tribolium castaneum]